MNITKILIPTIVFLTVGFMAKAQYFVELDTSNQKYRFPKLVYPQNPKVEEKVNTALHIDELLILPDKYKISPYEIVTYQNIWGIQFDDKYEYESWTDLTMHPNVLSVRIKGEKEDKQRFVFYKFFDKRTGDSFIFSDLFTKEGLMKLQDEIPSIGEINRFILKKDTICIDKGYNISKKYSLKNLKPYLSDYGVNLLFESDSIVKRNSLRGKFMEGKGENSSGEPMHYWLYIAQLDDNGSATVYYWNKKLMDLNWYSDATIKDGVLQADLYFYDNQSKENVHAMSSLHIKKQKDNTWFGELQLGSPFYELSFQEY